MVATVSLLTVRELSKSFPGQRALRNVDLDVHSGEIVAVVGQNGSGKSTLVKVLTGIHEPDAGSEISVRQGDGRQLTGHAARSAIHVIHQDLGLISTLSSVENLDLGVRVGGRGLLPNHGRSERDRARDLIARFGGDFDVTVPVDRLTPVERTIVAIARALDSWDRPEQILLLDEPTAALHGNEAKRLFSVVRQVAAQGAGVVFISHRLDEVLGLADRVVALRGGEVVANVPAADLDHHSLIELIVGRTMSEASEMVDRTRSVAALSLSDVIAAGLNGVDLTLYAGQVLGICGLLGSGMEQLASVIFGAAPRSSGTVTVAGRPLRAGSPRESVRRGIGFVPADRKADGAVMTMRARENLTLAGLRPLRGRAGGLNAKAERREAHAWLQRVELTPAQPERELELFSGGNQQKVVLAKWLRNKPVVLLLDEPTQGVDVGAKAAIYALIREAAAEGAGVLVSSSDTAELTGLCDRVVVFRDGRPVADVSRDQLDEARLVAESLGLNTSAASQENSHADLKEGALHGI